LFVNPLALVQIFFRYLKDITILLYCKGRLKISFYKSPGNWFFYKLVLYSAFMVFCFLMTQMYIPFQALYKLFAGLLQKNAECQKITAELRFGCVISFLATGFCTCGIACCVTHLCVRENRRQSTVERKTNSTRVRRNESLMLILASGSKKYPHLFLSNAIKKGRPKLNDPRLVIG